MAKMRKFEVVSEKNYWVLTLHLPNNFIAKTKYSRNNNDI
jgi:hypothetical protein